MAKRVCRLSCIVAAYNSEPYIFQCVDSLVQQTAHFSYEVIVVDDGSTDRTADLCQTLQKLHPSVRLIRHSCNKGLVTARRTGFHASSGEYVAFIDGDDYVAPRHISDLYRAAIEDQSDIVCSGYTEDSPTEPQTCFRNLFAIGLYKKHRLKELQQQMLYSCTGEFFSIFSELWNKLFHRRIVACLIDGVDRKIFIGEDGALSYPALLLAKRVTVISEYGYHYRQHEYSAVKSPMRSEHERQGLKYLWQHLKSVCDAHPSCSLQIRAYLSSLVWVRVDSVNRQLEGKSIYPALRKDDESVKENPLCIVGRGTFSKKVYKWLSLRGPQVTWAAGSINGGLDLGKANSSWLFVIGYFNRNDIVQARLKLKRMGIPLDRIVVPYFDQIFTTYELDRLLAAK